MVKLEIKNKKFYDFLLKLIEFIYLYAKEKNINYYIEEESDMSWERLDNCHYIRKTNKKNSLNINPVYYSQFIQSSNQYINYKKQLNDDRVISSQINQLVGTSYIKSTLGIDDIAKYILIKIINNNPLEINQKIFDSAFHDIQMFLYGNEIKFYKITPLVGLTLDFAKLILDDNIDVSKLADSEVVDFLDRGIVLGEKIGQDVVEINDIFAIKETYKTNKVIGRGIDDQSKITDKSNICRVVTDALRIYKKGDFYPAATIKFNQIPFYKSSNIIHERQVAGKVQNKYTLIKKDITPFSSFFKANRSYFSEKNSFSIAISRFSQYSERKSIDDKIIDLMISAESIFYNNDNARGVTSYQLSLRAALLLSKDAQERKDIYNFMKQAYAVRSNIVHGGDISKTLKTQAEQDTFLIKLENYLREAINIMFKKPIPKEYWLNEMFS